VPEYCGISEYCKVSLPACIEGEKRKRTEVSLQTRVPTFGSYFLEVVPYTFLKRMSEIIMLDLDSMLVTHVFRDKGGGGDDSTYRIFVAESQVLLTVALGKFDSPVIIGVEDSIICYVFDVARPTTAG
jgi:hypothetical protein